MFMCERLELELVLVVRELLCRSREPHSENVSAFKVIRAIEQAWGITSLPRDNPQGDRH